MWLFHIFFYCWILCEFHDTIMVRTVEWSLQLTNRETFHSPHLLWNIHSKNYICPWNRVWVRIWMHVLHLESDPRKNYEGMGKWSREELKANNLLLWVINTSFHWDPLRNCVPYTSKLSCKKQSTQCNFSLYYPASIPYSLLFAPWELTRTLLSCPAPARSSTVSTLNNVTQRNQERHEWAKELKLT